MYDEGFYFAFHDCMVELYELEVSEEVAMKMFFMLKHEHPNVLAEGLQWGWSDTCFRDTLYVFLRDNMELSK